jgi:hypothetical protein
MTCTAEQAEPGGSCFLAIPDQCPSGEYCDADIDAGEYTGSCRDVPAAGQDCASMVFSATGCQPYHACVDGTCRELQRLEGSCTADDECYGGNCAAGSCALLDPCG